MIDPQFRGRIKVACMRFAMGILTQGGSTNLLQRWAAQTYQQPDQQAQAAQPAVVMEPAVQGQGSSLNDSDLQFSVETAVQKLVTL
jgi:hypothetical protein